MSDDKSKTATIIQAGAKGGASAAMPYVAVAGLGVAAYFLIKNGLEEGTENFGASVTNSITERIESITETVKEVTGGNSDDPNTIYNLLLNPEMLPESLNEEIYANPDYHSATGNAGEWASFLTKGPIGAVANVIYEIGTAINPMPEDLKKQQKLLGSGNVTTKDMAHPDSLYSKLFGGGKSQTGINIPNITSHEQAVAMGLGDAPLAVNANLSLPSGVSNIVNKSSSKSTAKKIIDSGMPASNLKNASSVSTKTDKTGKDRVVVKYKNGVTLRY